MLIGRLGADPELKTIKSGAAVCNLTIATSEYDKDKKEKTEWHKVQVWGKVAENCAKYLKKGSLAYIEGRLQTRSWEKDGTKHYTTEIIAHAVQFLGSKGEGKNIDEVKPIENIEDIPF